MATLKDVVGKLEENNQKLGNIDTSIDKVEAGILGLFGLQKRAQLDQLEAAREAGQSATNVATLGNAPKGKGAGGDPDNEGGGLLSGLSGIGTGLLGGLGGLSLASILRGSFKRLPFLAMTLFGDEFAEYLKSAGFEAELADSFGQAIQAAGIAGMISPRLAPLAGILGLVIDKETAGALKDIKEDFVKKFNMQGLKDTFNKILEPINNAFKELGFDFNIDIDQLTWKNVLGWLRTNLIEGAQSLSNILLGEGSVKDIGQAAGVLGAIAFAFAPFRTIALASKIPGVAFLLGKKLLGAVTTLGSLALGLGDAAAAAPTGATASKASTAAKAAGTSTAFKAGRLAGGLLAFAGGPVGTAILAIGSVAALGAYVTEATKDAPVIVAMRKQAEEIRKQIETQPGMDMLDEGGLLETPEGGGGSGGGDRVGSAAYEAETKRLEKLAAEGNKRAGTLAAARKKATLEKQATDNRLQEAILSDQNRRQQSQVSNIVDASTTNVGQSTTALVGSGTNSFDANNPLIQRAMANLHG